MDDYFLSSQKAHPDLFGTPLILPCQESTSNQNLYQFVWTQVARLVSPLPPSEAKIPNHAQDWFVFLFYFTLNFSFDDKICQYASISSTLYRKLMLLSLVPVLVYL